VGYNYNKVTLQKNFDKKQKRMPPINNKKLILVIFAAIIISAGFGFSKESLAGYYSQGTLILKNLLSSELCKSI